MQGSGVYRLRAIGDGRKSPVRRKSEVREANPWRTVKLVHILATTVANERRVQDAGIHFLKGGVRTRASDMKARRAASAP
jgi:hypothetical protein